MQKWYKKISNNDKSYKTLRITTAILFCILAYGCGSPQSNLESPKSNIERQDTVFIRELKFHPEILYVQKGNTVVFVNQDLMDHDVTQDTSNLWTSGLLVPGQSWSRTFNEDVDYFCSLHVIMKGQVRLKRSE